MEIYSSERGKAVGIYDIFSTPSFTNIASREECQVYVGINCVLCLCWYHPRLTNWSKCEPDPVCGHKELSDLSLVLCTPSIVAASCLFHDSRLGSAQIPCSPGSLGRVLQQSPYRHVDIEFATPSHLQPTALLATILRIVTTVLTVGQNMNRQVEKNTELDQSRYIDVFIKNIIYYTCTSIAHGHTLGENR